MFLVQRFTECREIEIEVMGCVALAAVFVEAAAEEVGDVFDAAACADILEIDGGDGGVVGGEAEVGDFGVAVDEGFVAAVTEALVDLAGGVFEGACRHGVEFVGAGVEVPVGTGLPKAGGGFSEECGVEAGEPVEADPDAGFVEVLVADGETGVVKIFEYEEPAGVAECGCGDGAGDSGVRRAAVAPLLIPGEFDLVGAELAVVGAVGRPAAGVVGVGRWGDVFDDGWGAVEAGADDFAVAGPERLDAFADGYFGGAGELAGGLEPWWLGSHADGEDGVELGLAQVGAIASVLDAVDEGVIDCPRGGRAIGDPSGDGAELGEEGVGEGGLVWRWRAGVRRGRVA